MNIKIKTHRVFCLIMVGCMLAVSCKKKDANSNKLKVVVTTSIIADLVKNIGGLYIDLQSLMGSGVDPHLYKASEGDLHKLVQAEIIFYNGLHLEGKLVEVLDKMNHTTTVAIADAIDSKLFLQSENYNKNYDPHIWFNTQFWITISDFVAMELIKKLPDYKNQILENAKIYKAKLQKLESEIATKIAELPIEKRILITAHDAFNYFGQSNDFEVIGLQGLSTVTEAGVKDVQNMVNLIMENDVKAIFVESSVSDRTLKAVQEAVLAKGKKVEIGGVLFSDALGDPATPEGTYIGMYKHNTSTIIDALK